MMNEQLINKVAEDLKITSKQVEVVLSLLEEGNTIPFIARYRKERTGALTEEVIRSIEQIYTYQKNLLERKEDVIRLINEKGLLTEELKNSILKAEKLVEVEDLYRPYKEKKKTKATEAIQNGLEPLAKKIMSFPVSGNLDTLVAPFVHDKVKTKEDAIQGASYIIAEWLSDNASYRKWIRRFFYQEGEFCSQLKKNCEDDGKVYEMYYDYKEAVKSIKSHRILAINRGEKEGVLSVSIHIDKDKVVAYLASKVIKNKDSFVTSIVEGAILDSLKRLILPSVEREVRSELKEKAENTAIENFSSNLYHLLLTPPVKGKTVLGLDPAFRTGCKLAVLDKTGKVLEIAVIYPTEPRLEIEKSKKIVLDLIDKYNIELIAIGNGTASRESEAFIAKTIKEAKRKVEYVLVSEAGASVYSASPLAIKEFPDLTVEKRSAISIGRRVQDALSELVKIEPKSIGVGLYQHDVTSKKLDESLNFVVTKAVNQVGVNVNTASAAILSYVSGLTKKVISELLKQRDEKGRFESRNDLLKIKGMTPKIYEQSIGFLRILDGENPLDKTAIHPESYDKVRKLFQQLGASLDEIGKPSIQEKIASLDKKKVLDTCQMDSFTLEDILSSLENPGRDPRDNMPKLLLKSDILKIEDLKIGDQLQGTVRNVVDFGIFIDIGLKNDGLAHISKLSNSYIKHPKELFKIGDIVTCYVDEIALDKKKVSLTLLPR